MAQAGTSIAHILFLQVHPGKKQISGLAHGRPAEERINKGAERVLEGVNCSRKDFYRNLKKTIYNTILCKKWLQRSPSVGR